MLKMDFLGLRTLTLLKHAVDLIERHRGEKIDIFRLPMDDRDTFAMLQRGEARGVFQFEGEGIRELLKRMKPDGIRDIIASTALYRPGPLQGGMVDMYIDCKHGRQKPEYAHPVMEEVLAETYGVMVYQEQVMRILNRLGGIELSSAYACIKAISKKKHEIIEQRKSEFIKGAHERGVAEATARDIFEKIEKFGGYGFNKAHSAAYALVSYQTAYLKAHYKPEFMAALLTSEIEDNNKRDIMVEHINDARKNGVKVLPPCVNRSAADFTVSGDDVFFGLTAIKGVGRGAAEDMVRARKEGGEFRDVFDFCERIDHKVVPRVVLEKLIKAGAMDCFGKRSQMIQVWPRAMQAAAESQEDRRRGQMNLFGDGAATSKNNGHAAEDALPDIEEWHETEKLKYEKEVLDFYLSSHPLTPVEKDIQRFATHGVGKLLELTNGTEVLVGGMIGSVRFMNTKSARNGNSRFVRCTVEDFTGSIECLMWPDDLVKHKDDFVDDRVCFVRGILDRTRDRPVLVLNRVLTVEQVQREQTRGLWLLFTLGLNSERDVEAIGRILRRTPGNCPVHLLVRDAGLKNAVLKLGPEFAINPTSFSIGDMEVLLGAGNVKFA
jgi:DNA polymerase-3 subunit alpha